MELGRLWLKWFVRCIIYVLIILIVGGYATFKYAETQVNNVFPELIRLVAEDNCLDNTIIFSGKTTYQAYRDKLDTISNNSPLIEFRSDAISVPYTSRASAPQKGTRIPVKLTGYWTINVPIFSGFHAEFPIVREINVIGIRNYRDR